MKPRYITFTGADDQTSIDGMCDLSYQYPIEWGILFSPKHQGQGRYPSMRFIKQLLFDHWLDLSAHLCGGDSRDVISRRKSQHDDLIKSCFNRVQINTSNQSVDTGEILEWADSLKVRAILQCRSEFPSDNCVAWLFDTSGGRGIAPAAWPKPNPNVLCGYAGGLNPGNVVQAVEQIGAMTDNYWIDMESGVRTPDDKFDLQLCRQVCEAVYGPEARRAA